MMKTEGLERVVGASRSSFEKPLKRSLEKRLYHENLKQVAVRPNCKGPSMGELLVRPGILHGSQDSTHFRAFIPRSAFPQVYERSIPIFLILSSNTALAV